MFSTADLKYLRELREGLDGVAFSQYIEALDNAIHVLEQSNAIQKVSEQKGD